MRSIRRFVRSRVVVHTTDDQSIRGFLASVQRDHLVLSSPEYLAEGSEPQGVKGDAVVLRERVAWMQVGVD